MKTVSIFLIALVLVAGIVGCSSEPFGLNIASTEGGSVIVPGEGFFTYDEETVVNLTAEAEEGYRFVNWTGDVNTIADVESATTNINVSGYYFITAQFVAIYDLTISSTTKGNVTIPGEGTFTYDAGTVVSLNATPNVGCQFVEWTGDVGTIADVNAAATNVIMSDSYFITANFALEAQKLVASDGVESDFFGSSVSISGDRAIVGASSADVGGNYAQGAAYVFVRDDQGDWLEEQKLVASDGDAHDWFGHSVSISGDTAIVGAYWVGIGAENERGAAYVFVRDAQGNWLEEQKLVASDATAYNIFGWSVSISGDTIIVGAPGAYTEPAFHNGAAYVFVGDTQGNWLEEQKLEASDGVLRDRFGESVSISGDKVVVLAQPWGDDNPRIGAAYVFVRDGHGDWIEEQKMVASDGMVGDRFGGSASMSGQRVIVGAEYADIGANTEQGAAYVFVGDAQGNWTEEQKLVASDGMAGDWFGISVSMSGDVVMVSARGADGYEYRGAAYIFPWVPS